ncbi:SRPBCC family protein [Lentibacter algarum]|uniref:SRPBCC family protein n=1 Tax=Lentibacter algarum TaxID=576131 RepID=UPI001C0654E5|nr:SRPBCC family protein [Lentibacter algarum]MBU2981599.1 SRPBCC family protein [Lentibacter algarum]
MQLITNHDIEAPIEHVFTSVTDFDGFARRALRRGAEVSRVDSCTEDGEGMIWDTAFGFRGKSRKMRIELTEFDAPNKIAAQSEMTGLNGMLVMDLVALSRQRTRLSIDLTLAPQSLSARLLVQSLKLARGNLTKRLSKRLAQFATEIEEDYKRNA